MKQSLYIFTTPYKKYIEDIDFLAYKLKGDIEVYLVYTDIIKNDIEFNKKYFFNLYKLNNFKSLKKSNYIFLRYGRWYWDYITYILYKNKLLLHSDGIGFILGNKIYNINTNEKRNDKILNILLRYIKIYGFLYTLIMIFRNRFLKDKTDFYGIIKNYGVLELTRIYNNNNKKYMNSNIKEKNQILILEQPFIKNLDKEKLQNFFYFIDDLIEKNQNYKIIFKIHPRSDERFYKDNINSKNIYFEKGDILEFIKESKYILGFFSTALFSSLLFNKKVIVIDPIGLFKNIEEFELLKYKNTNYIKKAEKLDNINFDNSKKEKKVEELLFDFEQFKKDLKSF